MQQLSDLLNNRDRAALAKALPALKKVQEHVEKNSFNQWCNVVTSGDERAAAGALNAAAGALRGITEFIQLCDNAGAASGAAKSK